MKSNWDLVKDAFNAVNDVKRSRALAEIARSEGNTEKAIYHELKQYKAFDKIELALRAIQQNERERNGYKDIERLSEESNIRTIRAIN